MLFGIRSSGFRKDALRPKGLHRFCEHVCVCVTKPWACELLACQPGLQLGHCLRDSDVVVEDLLLRHPVSELEVWS